MEAEVTAAADAGYGERTPDRTGRRNGYRERDWDTRVGSIELAIPKLRAGSYFPSFLELRRRSEQALVAVVQEAYVNGVSTRKVDRLVEALAWPGCPKTPSPGCAVAWTSRSPPSWSGRWRRLSAPVVGRKVEKARAGGRAEHRALVGAYGVDQSDQRELIGLDVGGAETQAFWREVLCSLVRRGPAGVQLVVSDATKASRPPSPRC